MRVHTLAKELNVSSKDIIQKCEAEGIHLKNHMSTVGAGLEATVREWFTEGAHETTVETAKRVDLEKVRKKKAKAKKKTTAQASSIGEEETKEVVPVGAADATAEALAAPAPSATETPVEATPSEQEKRLIITDEPQVQLPVQPAVEELAEKPAETEAIPVETVGHEAAPTVQPATEEPEPAVTAEEITIAEAEAEPTEVRAEAKPKKVKPAKKEPETVAPAGPQNVPLPAKLSGPRVVRYEAPEEYSVPKRGPRRRSSSTGPKEAQPKQPFEPIPVDLPGQSEKPGRGHRRSGGDDKARGGKRGSKRSYDAATLAGEKLSEWNDQDLAERRARLRGATGRRMVSRRATQKSGSRGQAAARITKAQVEEPITVKQLCGAIGVPFQQVFPVLKRDHNVLVGITNIIDKDVAELLATEFGVELKVVEAKTGLEKLKEEHAALPRNNMAIRPPIVTVLGHVDHGKTSLLDRIRKANIAGGEDGGITQHISSYHIKNDNIAVTFLDTPGHEAFTALRARGANLTDVVVLVIAADDGIMPQTVEAINHAKAAGVPIVVALNKIDLGTQNVTRIYTQLTEHDLTPSGDWGGQTDVIHTSATTGEGVDELLEHLTTLAELHEFKADLSVPATGIVVEAESRQGVGPVLQVIIKEGVLKVGDAIVCGNAYGKVRALHDDTGRKVPKLGPAMPAEIWGINEVPSAGDTFIKVGNVSRAKEIAQEVKQTRLTDARSSVKKARSLDDLIKQRSSADVNELNVIIKGDVDGSVDVLNQTLNRFPSDEVKLNVLHAGIGAVTDSDVHLADASDAIIIAFRVSIPATTRKVAEEQGVDIRTYKVIYDVTDDIKKALEGLLAPDEKIEQRGMAEVRELFRISKVGLIAGSYVREGVMSAKHFARVVRDGTVVRDNCKFDSLRRFKDDAKEVRSGMECGIRLEGFDDIKVGDMIECFEVIKVARTLD